MSKVGYSRWVGRLTEYERRALRRASTGPLLARLLRRWWDSKRPCLRPWSHTKLRYALTYAWDVS